MAYNLKNEEEVKEFLKNLYTEYQFGCYSENKPEVCHLLGDYYEGIKGDIEKAATLYKTTCDKYSYGRSCTKFGDFKTIGNGCKRDLVEAYKYMTKGCEANDVNGCVHAGILGTSKEKLMEDRPTQLREGVKHLKKACDMFNSEKACFYLSGIYIGGLEGVIDKNLKEAYKIALKSCELGNPYACANLSQMHARGEGAQKNDELAATFKKRAIELYDEMKNVKSELKFQQGMDA